MITLPSALGPLAAGFHRHGVAAVLVTVLFTIAAFRMRAVNVSGAIAGAIVSFLLYSSMGPGGFAVLATVFAVTAVSTRLGMSRKQNLGLAERKHGRSGWQVLANLAVGTLLGVVSLYVNEQEFRLAACAALAEAAADTASSECGQALTSRVYLILNFERVAVGTDGGISLIGTLCGVTAALLVALVAAWCHLVPIHWIAAVGGAAVIGTFVDSLLGAAVQRRGWLSNNSVNFLSTIAAALIALAFLQ